MNDFNAQGKSRKMHILGMIGLFFVLGLLVSAALRDAHAAGKKKASENPTQGCPSQGVVAKPIRPVVVMDINTKEFPLQPGKVANLTLALTDMLKTEITKTGVLSYVIPAPHSAGGPTQNPCDWYHEIIAKVTALELDLYNGQVWIGYTGDVTHSGLAGAMGSVEVHVGKFVMDFSIVECIRGQCASIVAAKADQSLLGTETKITLDFGMIQAGPSLATQPSFEKAARKIMAHALQQMTNDAKFNSLNWVARVQEVNAANGAVVINAGTRSNLGQNQNFIIYSLQEGVGSCPDFHKVAYIHTTQVDPVTSDAQIDQTFGDQRPQSGDLVMIRMQR